MDSTEQIGSKPRSAQGGLTIFFILLVLLIIIQQFLPAPSLGFLVDDWANYEESIGFESWGALCKDSLIHSSRPLSLLAVRVVYYSFGEQFIYFSILSVIAKALILAMGMWIAVMLYDSKRIACLFGLIFVLLPNHSENMHNLTMIVSASSVAIPLYLVAMGCWVKFILDGRKRWLVASSLTYALGLFSYEIGALLPAAMALLLLTKPLQIKKFFTLLPHAGTALFYGAWRLTNSFGLNPDFFLPVHMQAERGISLWEILWNIRENISWWGGAHMLRSVTNGLQEFLTLPASSQRGWYILVVAFLLVMCIQLRRQEGGEDTLGQPLELSTWRSVAFLLAWAGLAMAISTLSYTAQRLNTLPGIALALLLALLLGKRPLNRSSVGLVLLVGFLVLSNIGTAVSWERAAAVNRSIYRHLQANVDQWMDKDVVLFDTQGIVDRNSPGLEESASPVQVVAFHGNASLLRGFVFPYMMKLVSKSAALPQAVMDVESGVKIEGGTLYWHKRFNPAVSMETPLERVFIIDCLATSLSGGLDPVEP